MYSFILLNIARLFTKTKSKYKVLYDLCSLSTLFICLCETFLTEDISDSEIQIPEFSIVRCDRHLREGGGVCIYVRTTNPFNVCVKYSNSICDLLIINIHHPSLIIIMMYRPPSCPAIEFNDIIQKAKCYIMSLPSPLPNIIMLGDINLPNIDWSCPDINCPIASPLTDLASLLFLNQQVNKPTRKHNILDLIFCSDELINSVITTDTFLSDHRIINVSTCIPIPNDIIQSKSLNPPTNIFERLDFNRCDWPHLAESLRNLDWSHELCNVSPEMFLPFATGMIADKCMLFVPKNVVKRK